MFGFGRLAAGADKGSDNESQSPVTPHRRGRGTFHRPDEDGTLHWEHLDTMPQKLTHIPTAGSEWTKIKVKIREEEVDMVRSPHAPKPGKKQPAQRQKKGNGKEGGMGGGAMGAVVRPALSSSVPSDEPDSTSSKRRRRREKKAVLNGEFSSPSAKTKTPTLQQWMDMQRKTPSTAVAVPTKTKDVFSFKQASLSTPKTPSAAEQPAQLAPAKLSEATTPKTATVEKGQERSDVQPSLAAPEPVTTAEIRETATAALAPTFKLSGLFASRKVDSATEKNREEAELLASLKMEGFSPCKTETTEKREAVVPPPSVPTLKLAGLFASKTQDTAEKREVTPSLAALEKASAKTAEPVVAKQAELELFGAPLDAAAEPVKPMTSPWSAGFMRMLEKANATKASEPAPRAESAMRRTERV